MVRRKDKEYRTAEERRRKKVIISNVSLIVKQFVLFRNSLDKLIDEELSRRKSITGIIETKVKV